MHTKIVTFVSDNYSGVHPKIMQSLHDVNHGSAVAYGNDQYTLQAIEIGRNIFGKQSDICFVLNGTGANIVGLRALIKPYQAIICAETAHINVHECGAIENNSGAKLLLVPTENGKITIKGVSKYLHQIGFQLSVQPKVISITQSTEWGTVYTIDEIKELVNFAHENGMYLHMDGARLANAAAHLQVSLQEMTIDLGVDVVSFGGTKNGMMFGEMIVFKDREISKDIKYIRDQSTQLVSKMRYISAQFSTMFKDDLWFENAKHANHMAQILAEELIKIPGIRLAQVVQSNGVFIYLPKEIIIELQKQYACNIWDYEKSIIRLMTSWNTTQEDLDGLIDAIKKLVSY